MSNLQLISREPCTWVIFGPLISDKDEEARKEDNGQGGPRSFFIGL
jgi:hypothetical protein